jgi:hypothetical protein
MHEEPRAEKLAPPLSQMNESTELPRDGSAHLAVRRRAERLWPRPMQIIDVALEFPPLRVVVARLASGYVRSRLDHTSSGAEVVCGLDVVVALEHADELREGQVADAVRFLIDAWRHRLIMRPTEGVEGRLRTFVAQSARARCE